MDQQTVVVIGGSSGIGHEVARQISTQGARLIITGRNAAKLDAVRLSGAVETAVLDAHDETALESFFSRLESVDHLVSMIGDSMTGGVSDYHARDHAPRSALEILDQLDDR